MVKNKTELKRVNINLPVSLIERVTEYAQDLGINTTAAYIVLLNHALEQKETLSNLPAIMDFIVAAREFQNTYSVNNQDVNNKLDINQLNDKLNINNKLED